MAGQKGKGPSLAADEAKLRRVIKDWMRTAWSAAEKNHTDLAVAMGEGRAWLSEMLSHSTKRVPEKAELERFASVTKWPVSAEAAAARLALDRLKGFLQGVYLNEAPADGTAAAEMRALIELAYSHQAARDAARNIQMMAMRLGLASGEPLSMAEVARRTGVASSRVGQLEAAMFSRLRASQSRLPTPALDAVADAAAARPGLLVSVVESELAQMLGGAPLSEALRFWEGLSDRHSAPQLLHSGVAGFQSPIIDGGPFRPLVGMVWTGATKGVAYAGACMVADLRRYVEEQLQLMVPVQDVVSVVDALPNVEWLEGKRWFHFGGQAMTGLLARAHKIIDTASAPLGLDALYGRLARAHRHGPPNGYADYCDPIPPPAIVLAILDRHPAFRVDSDGTVAVVEVAAA